MRTLPDPIFTAYESGRFVGESKFVWRVTVEPAWWLNSVNDPTLVGALDKTKLPIRYWQKSDNGQTEVEIPNIKTVTIDESIDQPASACELTITNVWMDDNLSGRADRLGIHGYFSPTQNSTPEAVARWGEADSPWQGVLEANALLRVYKGVAGPVNAKGHPALNTEDALAAGYLILDGVFLIDDWEASSDGGLTFRCRNMGALLIDQLIYPPLVPAGLYPLEYSRWLYDPEVLNAGTITQTVVTPGAAIQAGDKRTAFELSNVDLWYPGQIDQGGFLLHGHRGIHAFDGNPDTWWLSVGNAHPDRSYAYDWVQSLCGEPINAVYIHTWAGNYQLFISVMEGGQWQGSDVIPYDPTPLGATQSYVDTGAAIPYVASFGTPWEQGVEYPLPRVYQAERVRITFHNPALSPWGPFFYRSGVREYRNRLSSAQSTAGTVTQVTVPPLFFAADALCDPADNVRTGYITNSTIEDQFDVFGDCRTATRNHGPATASDGTTAVRLTADGAGYWRLYNNGVITSYGNAGFAGDPANTFGYVKVDGLRMTDIAGTNTGLGYWVLRSDGVVYAFGDAVDYGPVTPTGSSAFFSIDGHPSAMGYWAMDTNGKVTARGACTDFGDFSEVVLNHTPGNAVDDGEAAVCLRATSGGDGYWILTDAGRVQGLGAAVDYGQITDLVLNGSFYDSWYKLLPAPDDGGYLLMRGDGTIVPAPEGNVEFFGSPVPGSYGELRRDGNLLDWADAVKDLLLWCGFWLYPELDDENKPAVYGNIETTGAYPKDTIPLEFFDKVAPVDAIKKIAEIVGYCVDDQTEIFTKRGWLTWDQVKPGDETLAIDPSSEFAEFRPIAHVYSEQASGTMVHLHGRSHESLTTANHRWLVRPRDSDRLVWTTSDRLRGTDAIPTAAPRSDLPQQATSTDELVELVAWWYTEGSYRPNKEAHRGSISQSERVNPHYVARIREVLKSLFGDPGPLPRGRAHSREIRNEVERRLAAGEAPGAVSQATGLAPSTVWNWKAGRGPALNQWDEHTAAHDMRVFVLGAPVIDAIEAVCPDKVPSVEWLCTLTAEQLDLFIETSVRADGWVDAGGDLRWCQKDEARLRSFEAACVLAGRPVRSHYTKDKNRDIWTACLLRRSSVEPVAAARKSGRPVLRIPYEGVIWCPTVPGHGNWLARRQGQIFYTGNCFYVDGQGAIRWSSPNWWNWGNFLEDGTYTTEMVELDERWNLMQASVRGTKQNDRSEIIISTEEPTAELDDTLTTRFIPPNLARLRGMVRPAVVVHPALSDPDEQATMAELVAMHLWFRQRTATIKGPEHLGVTLDDQVRLLERTTGETNVFYILSKRTEYDREAGTAFMTLGAHWLGDRDSWAIALTSTGGGIAAATSDPTDVTGEDRYRFTLSRLAQGILERRGVDLEFLKTGSLDTFAASFTAASGDDGAASG